MGRTAGIRRPRRRFEPGGRASCPSPSLPAQRRSVASGAELVERWRA